MLSFPSMPFLRTGIALLCACASGHAALDFHTYRVVKTVIKVMHDGKYVDSTRITYELTRLGSVSLEASSLTLTSRGGYLSVVEEATLTGNVEDRPHDITQDFLLQGSVPIPPLAAVHALSARHADTLFRAKLRKSTYSLNDAFFDTTALQSTLQARVAFLQQLSDASFEACFTKLSLGEPVRVRIEYHIPFSGAPGTAVRIPVLFHPSGQPPRQAHITFFEESPDLPPVQWLGPNGHVTLNAAGTLTVPYQDEFLIRRDESPKSVVTLQSTTFETGKLKGQYLLFKGGLNDSLMNLLSRPMEVVFLWRWNPPYDFVEIQGGLKTLSPLGRLAAAEARILKQVILEFAPRGHRFGLLRSAPDNPDEFFPPAEAGSDDYGKLLAYLERFTEQRIYADYKNYKNDKPAWSASNWSDSGEVVKSRQDFLAVLGRIRKSFSDRPDALRHIQMIGLGSAPATLIDGKDPKAVEDIIDSTTLANAMAPWLGMDMGRSLKLRANENLRPLAIRSPLAADAPPLFFPIFQPASVEYRAFTPSRSHAVVLPFGLDAEREAMLKASQPFGDTLQLQGIDALGRKTRIFTLNPRMLRSQADTNLAQLWAADPDRIAEESEVDLGMRYGILTKGTYWGAGIEDATLVIPDGTPVLPKSVQVRGRRVFHLESGFLRIDYPDKGPGGPGRAPFLLVYDIRGRLVLRMPLDGFRNAGGFAIPIGLLRRLGPSRLVLTLRGAGRVESFILNFGGRP